MNDNFGFAQVVPDPQNQPEAFEAKSENGKKDKQAKKDLAADLHSHIVSGSIANRNQLIGYMKKKGLHIALIGDEFITVRLPGADKNTRLKGPLFSKDSDYAAWWRNTTGPRYPVPHPGRSRGSENQAGGLHSCQNSLQPAATSPLDLVQRVQKLASGPTGGIRKGGRDKEPTTPQHDTTEIRPSLKRSSRRSGTIPRRFSLASSAPTAPHPTV